nr:hypothetical protein [uncultured Capnocytophaga sp.]
MYKKAKYGALALGILGVVLWVLMSLNSDIDPTTKDYSDTFYSLQEKLLVLTYLLLGITLLAVLISAGMNIVSSPKALKKTLIYIGAFVAVLVVSYIFSSGEVEANASEEVKKATDSVRKWVSTGLIALYILVAGAVVALIAANVKKALMR